MKFGKSIKFKNYLTEMLLARRKVSGAPNYNEARHDFIESRKAKSLLPKVRK